MALIGDKIGGNTKGISDFWLGEIEALRAIETPRGQLFSEELATAMARITGSLGVEIAVYIDRRGRIEYLQVGDKHSVDLVNSSKRGARHHLSGLRCVHTHPNGSGALSQPDLTALPMLRFDAMVAIGVDCTTEPPSCGTVGVAFGVLEDEAPRPVLCPDVATAAALDFLAMVAAIEKAAAKTMTHYDQTERPPRALLVNITGKQSEHLALYSLSELAELAKTAGVEVVDQVLQRRATPEGATFIGKGKAEELRFTAQILQVDSLIFDSELSPVQMRNLEAITGRAIIDRSMLILDIFAARAQSNEGKLQVELAQLRYMMPRLVGQGEVLSRLGGGIGTRGPGETKLEVDKRVIRKRINELENRLQQVVKTRELHRKQRSKENLAIVALVGYTNAGKSTLLNALTEAGVLAEDKLFATLDTTTRRFELPNGRIILLIDTVGFVRNLPHHLVAAFRATLEEVCEADLLLHVMDSSAEELDEQVIAVNEVLTGLHCETKTTIAVLNKMDLVDSSALIAKLTGHYDNAVAISAKHKQGLDELFTLITELLPQQEREVTVLLPYSEGALLNIVHEKGRVQAEEYVGEGVKLRAVVPNELYERLLSARYIVIE